jgi:hypothetical protein
MSRKNEKLRHCHNPKGCSGAPWGHVLQTRNGDLDIADQVQSTKTHKAPWGYNRKGGTEIAALGTQRKKKQIDINHTQEGISHSHKPSAQEEGDRRDGKWMRYKTADGAG